MFTHDKLSTQKQGNVLVYKYCRLLLQIKIQRCYVMNQIKSYSDSLTFWVTMLEAGVQILF